MILYTLDWKISSLGFIDNESSMVEIMACRQSATRHYLNQWWSSLPIHTLFTWFKMSYGSHPSTKAEFVGRGLTTKHSLWFSNFLVSALHNSRLILAIPGYIWYSGNLPVLWLSRWLLYKLDHFQENQYCLFLNHILVLVWCLMVMTQNSLCDYLEWFTNRC